MTEPMRMPLVHLDQSFPAFENPSEYLADLTVRIRSYIAQEPHVIFEHPYRDLTIAVWFQSMPNGFIAHLLVADRPHVKNECPTGALLFDLSEILGLKDVRLRDVHQYMKSEAWLQLIDTEHNMCSLKDTAVD